MSAREPKPVIDAAFAEGGYGTGKAGALAEPPITTDALGHQRSMTAIPPRADLRTPSSHVADVGPIISRYHMVPFIAVSWEQREPTAERGG
jgi:hypothetical protein